MTKDNENLMFNCLLAIMQKGNIDPRLQIDVIDIIASNCKPKIKTTKEPQHIRKNKFIEEVHENGITIDSHPSLYNSFITWSTASNNDTSLMKFEKERNSARGTFDIKARMITFETNKKNWANSGRKSNKPSNEQNTKGEQYDPVANAGTAMQYSEQSNIQR